jgi:pathogenesis-related protein 1
MRTFIFCSFILFFSVQSFFGQNSYTWQGHNISFSSPVQLQIKSNDEQGFVATSDKITVNLSVAGGMDGVNGLEGSLQTYVESFYQKSLSASEIPDQGAQLYGATVMAENMGTRYLVGLFCQTNYTGHFICEIAYLKGGEQLAGEVMASLKPEGGSNNKAAVNQIRTNNNPGNTIVDNGQNNNQNKSVNNNQPNKQSAPAFNNQLQGPVWNKQKIVLYGNTSCVNTINTRKILDSENIEYTFYDVLKDGIRDNEMYGFLRKYGFMYKIVYPVGFFDSSFYNKLDESWVSSIVEAYNGGQKISIIGDNSATSKNLRDKLKASGIKFEYSDRKDIANCEADIIKNITSVNQVWYPVTVINDTLVINGSHNFTDDIVAIAKKGGSTMVDPDKVKTGGNQEVQVEKGEPKEMAGMVDRHNYWRDKVGVPHVEWSDPLASFAQKWADELKKHDCDLIHSSDNSFGENLFGGSGAVFTPQDAVDAWASELSVFVYEPFTGDRGDGHYTQMVWENTTHIGCAKATCATGYEVWVCEYSPAGNYIGEFPYKKKK